MEFEAVFNNFGKNNSAYFSLSKKFWTVRMHLYALWILNLDYNSINNCHFKLLYIFSILKRYILYREFIDLKFLKRISICIIWVGGSNKLLRHNINKQFHLLCVILASEFIHQSYCVMFNHTYVSSHSHEPIDIVKIVVW